MSREIKFRVWEKSQSKSGKMYYPYENSQLQLTETRFDGHFLKQNIVNDYGQSFCSSKEGDHIIMQYTGLKDKNGKEIYEGDVLKQWTEGIGNYWVTFENGSFVCYHRMGKWGLLSRAFELDNFEPEVIGNIYEHNHLIEKQ